MISRAETATPAFVVVMGIAGCGKTEVATRLAASMGCAFLEADLLHSAGNIERMQQGIGLGDEHRWPWLDAVAEAARAEQLRPVIIACSALRRRYRDFLRERLGQVRFVFLHGSPDIIAARLASRRGHFATASLLESQLAALEPPDSDEDAVGLDIRWSLDQLTESAARALGAAA